MRKNAIVGALLGIFGLVMLSLPLDLAVHANKGADKQPWDVEIYNKNGSSSSNGNGNGNGNGNTNTDTNTNTNTNTSTSTSTDTFTQYQQTPGYTNEIKVDFDGNPSNISGKDHFMDAPYGEVPNQANLPAIAIADLTGTYIDGSGGPAGAVGIEATDANDDLSQVEGGIVNNVDNSRYAGIEEFVQSAKLSADITINTTANTNVVKSENFGTKDNPVVVYAAPSDTGNEKNLHFSGNKTGYGVLVIEVNDPKKGGLKINSKFKWIGTVIIVVNYRDTNNNNNGNAVPLTMNGGGNNSDGHILGGAVIYHRNQVHPTDGNGEVLDRTLANVSGGGSIYFSAEAVNNAKVEAAIQVRSWRKLVE